MNKFEVNYESLWLDVISHVTQRMS